MHQPISSPVHGIIPRILTPCVAPPLGILLTIGTWSVGSPMGPYLLLASSEICPPWDPIYHWRRLRYVPHGTLFTIGIPMWTTSLV